MNGLKGTLTIGILLLIGLFSSNAVAYTVTNLTVTTWADIGTK